LAERRASVANIPLLSINRIKRFSLIESGLFYLNTSNKLLFFVRRKIIEEVERKELLNINDWISVPLSCTASALINFPVAESCLNTFFAFNISILQGN
jgi:hypothetical protein